MDGWMDGWMDERIEKESRKWLESVKRRRQKGRKREKPADNFVLMVIDSGVDGKKLTQMEVKNT